MRGYSPYYDKGIAKLDICSDEDAVPYMDLKDSLDILITAKQELTLHVGETTPRDLNFILVNYPTVKQFNHRIQGALDPIILEKMKKIMCI
ncbi:hypothetical protein IT418_02320 [bacterium]|nr:hypothetical protein [bacterium]